VDSKSKGPGQVSSLKRQFKKDDSASAPAFIVHPHGIAIAQFLAVKSQFMVMTTMSHFQTPRCQIWIYEEKKAA